MEKGFDNFPTKFPLRCGSHDDACLVSYMRHEDGKGLQILDAVQWTKIFWPINYVS